jgi:N-methylhydantoinase A
MIVAPRGRRLSRTLARPLRGMSARTIEDAFAPLIAAGRAELVAEGVPEAEIEVRRELDLRYQGQSFALTVPWRDVAAVEREFHELHERRYGHRMDHVVELVNVRVHAQGPAGRLRLERHVSRHGTPAREIALHGVESPAELRERDALEVGAEIAGPALIVERIATTYVAPHWRARVDEWGNLSLARIFHERPAAKA